MSYWQPLPVGVAGVATLAVTLLWWLRKTNSVKPEYYTRVRQRLELERKRRAQLAEQLSDDSPQTADQRARILQLPLVQLVEQLQLGQLTAVQVLRAYQVKALEVTARYNCVTEFILYAEERSAALDRLPPSSRGPLHGVPISVKDSVDVQGMDSTGGLAKYLNKPAAVSGPVVQTLLDLGAVPFCKTNVPQTMLSFGCSNPVWGITRNIHDETRVPGGSSGGEGVLVAAGGSPLGVGTDVGGSTRVPALFSGCCGFKPTCGRLSYDGVRGVIPATFGVRSTIGFLTREAAGLRRVMQLLTTPSPAADMYRLDPLIPRVHWDTELADRQRPLRVGYLTEEALFPCTPGCRRVVMKAAAVLEAAGHQLVPFRLNTTLADMRLFFRALQPENGAFMVKAVADEEVDKSIENFVTMRRCPPWLRSVLAWGTDGRFRFLPTLLRARNSSLEEFVGVQHSWQQLIARVVKQWRAERIDLLLMPGFICPAPQRDVISRLTVGGFYTCLFNLLNFPAGVLPVDRETEEDQTALDSYSTPHVELRWIKEATRGALGQPLGVQLAALPWMEEQLLAGMEVVEQLLQQHN